MEVVPTIGRIVIYTLTDQDAAEINRRRTTGKSIAERLNDGAWPRGAQAHIGNQAQQGDECPMVIVRVWGTYPTSCVNGQLLLDGNDTMWKVSVSIGEVAGTWRWPVKS